MPNLAFYALAINVVVVWWCVFVYLRTTRNSRFPSAVSKDFRKYSRPQSK